MKRITRPVLVGVLLLLVLTSACNLPAPTPPTGTMTQEAVPTSSPAISATGTPIAAIIPITGENVVQMQCQFCVNDRTHSVFIVPEFAIFDVESTTPVTCLTAKVVNGKRVLVCHGTQDTSFNLKICSDPTNCLLYPVALQPCPLLPNTGSPSTTGITSTPRSPVFLTPINTLLPPANTPVLPDATFTQTDVAPPQPTSPVVPTTQPSSTPAAPPPATSTDVPPPPPPTTGGGQEGGDLVICHSSPGNPDNRKTMTVSQSSWDTEHSRHGDSLGECP